MLLLRSNGDDNEVRTFLSNQQEVQSGEVWALFERQNHGTYVDMEPIFGGNLIIGREGFYLILK